MQNEAYLILDSMSFRAKRINLMIASALRDCVGTACLAMTKERNIDDLLNFEKEADTKK